MPASGGVDLTGVDLSGVDLSGVDLSGVAAAPVGRRSELNGCPALWRRPSGEPRLFVSNNQHLKGFPMRLSHLPLRLTTGAFILNSGLNKRRLDAEGAAGLQAMAARVYPPASSMKPELFGKMLSYAEMSLGAALLAPFVPSRLAGVGLAFFSGSLFTIYLKTPGMTLADGIRPSQQGTVLAKDVWMLGIAGALILDRKGAVKRSGGAPS
ncbi:hypothetical protein RCH17_002072 [Arthrobacter sp. MP_M7]|nr:hypothetical protein [Arthrobacter sp. MP_M7]